MFWYIEILYNASRLSDNPAFRIWIVSKWHRLVRISDSTNTNRDTKCFSQGIYKFETWDKLLKKFSFWEHGLARSPEMKIIATHKSRDPHSWEPKALSKSARRIEATRGRNRTCKAARATKTCSRKHSGQAEGQWKSTESEEAKESGHGLDSCERQENEDT